MSVFEIVAAVLGIISVFFSTRQNILAWPTSLLNNAMYGEDMRSKFPAVGAALSGKATKDVWTLQGRMNRIAVAPIPDRMSPGRSSRAWPTRKDGLVRVSSTPSMPTPRSDL